MRARFSYGSVAGGIAVSDTFSISIFHMEHDLSLRSDLVLNALAVTTIPFCGSPCRKVNEGHSETQHLDSGELGPGRRID